MKKIKPGDLFILFTIVSLFLFFIIKVCAPLYRESEHFRHAANGTGVIISVIYLMACLIWEYGRDKRHEAQKYNIISYVIYFINSIFKK